MAWRSASLEGLALGECAVRTYSGRTSPGSQIISLRIFGSPQGPVRSAALRLMNDYGSAGPEAATASAVQRAIKPRRRISRPTDWICVLIREEGLYSDWPDRTTQQVPSS